MKKDSKRTICWTMILTFCGRWEIIQHNMSLLFQSPFSLCFNSRIENIPEALEKYLGQLIDSLFDDHTKDYDQNVLQDCLRLRKPKRIWKWSFKKNVGVNIYRLITSVVFFTSTNIRIIFSVRESPELTRRVRRSLLHKKIIKALL